MSKIFLLLACGFNLLACQSTPKQFPEKVELQNAFYSPSAKGYNKLDCKIHLRQLDESDSSYQQETARVTFGRIMTEPEIVALKSYDWTLHLSKDDVKIIGKSETDFGDSPEAKRVVLYYKNNALSVGKDLLGFFLNPLLNSSEKPSHQELVPGGFRYVYDGIKGISDITVNSSLDAYKIKYTPKDSSKSSYLSELSFQDVNGHKVLASLDYRADHRTDKTFYEFALENGEIVPTHVTFIFYHHAKSELSLSQCIYSQ